MNSASSITTGEAHTREQGDDGLNDTNNQDPAHQARSTALILDVLQDKLGCVIFAQDEHELFLCEDQVLDPELVSTDDEFDAIEHNSGLSPPSFGSHDIYDTRSARSDFPGLLDSLLFQFQPALVVASSRCTSALLSRVRKYVVAHRAEFEVRPAKDFQLNFGLQALSQVVSLGSETTKASPLEPNNFCDAVSIDAIVSIPRSTLSISAVGPLLACLREQGIATRILSFHSLSLDSFLFMDEDTLKGLSICSSDEHACVHASGGREGFSMLAMLQLTCSKYSHALLKRWVWLPLASKELIERRHDAVELLVQMDASQHVVEIRLRIAELAKVPQLCFLLNMGVGSIHTWERLYKTCSAMHKIKILLSRMRLDSSKILFTMQNELTTDDVGLLLENISRVIDWEESKNDGRITVRAGVDDHLDTLRANHAGLPDLLDRVAREIRLETAFLATQHLHVVYFPQIGYLIVVPGGETVDMLADDSLEQQFSSETNVYLKNSRMVDMDQHLGDLSSFIVDREIELLDDLHNRLVEYQPQVLRSYGIILELDCLLAFSRASVLYNLKRPVLKDKAVLKLSGCRHPLKALSDDNFVPNDIELWGGCGFQDSASISSRKSIMVLTGANSSGKSCLLQQAALAVFMSQCGCFVPAVEAELGVFDKILTRIRQDESVASEGSSFTRELGRLNRAISCSTSRSLILLDEVGRECRSDDGAGLFIATVQEFLERGQECPIVLSATHHLRAIAAHLRPTPSIYQAQMQTVFLPDAEATNTLTYLYRLCPGFAGTSHSSHCALLCGVPSSIVNRAIEILQTGVTAWQDDQAAEDELIVRRLLQLDFGQLQSQTDRFDQQKLRKWILPDQE